MLLFVCHQVTLCYCLCVIRGQCVNVCVSSGDVVLLFVCHQGTVCYCLCVIRCRCVTVCVLSGDSVRCEDPAVSIQTELAMEQLRDKHSQELHSLRVELETKVPSHLLLAPVLRYARSSITSR